MIILVFLAVLMCFLIELYFFFCIRRALIFVFSSMGKRAVCLWSLGITLGLTIGAVIFSSYSIWLVFIIHIIVFNLAMRLLNLIFKNFAVWNGIYRLSLIPLVLTLGFFTYGYFNMSNTVRTVYHAESDKLENPLKIALLADVHHGTAGNIGDIRTMAHDINREGVDIAVLCGDIIDEGASIETAKEIFAELGKIETARGVYFVYGNHDCSSYRPNPNYTRAELEKVITDAGIEILADEYKRITDEVILAGRLDKSMERKSVSELLSGADKESFIIVADHQPTDFAEKSTAGVSLQISGHTHGGQIFPVGYINTLISPNEQCYGMEKFGGMISVVSSGVYGWGFPIRTQGHSEWVLIDVL